MKDLRDFLRGEGWDEDLASGLFLPPGTVKGDLYEVQGGPQHTSNPRSFYFVSQPERPKYDDGPLRQRMEELLSKYATDQLFGSKISFSRQHGIAILSDGTVLRTEDGETRELHGLDRLRARAGLRGILGLEIADAAGIEPE